MECVNKTMHRQGLAALPGILNDAVLGHMVNLLNHVELAQPIHPILNVCDLIKDRLMEVTHVLDVTQPVGDQTGTFVQQGRTDTATAIMADHHDVLDLQHLDRKLQHRQAVEIGVHHHVGNVPVHKQFPWHQINNLVRRYSAVRTANP